MEKVYKDFIYDDNRTGLYLMGLPKGIGKTYLSLSFLTTKYTETKKFERVIGTRLGKEMLEGLEFDARIYINEAHLLFRSKGTSEFVNDLFKRARKFGGIPTCDSNSEKEEFGGPLFPYITDDNMTESEWIGSNLLVKELSNK